MGVTLECFARAMKVAYLDRDRKRGLFETFSWLVEEIGELAEALRTGDKSKIMEEIADVLAWTLSIANLVDIDVEESVRLKYGRDLNRVECL